MASLPYIKFYIADYLADTAHLSTEEHGAYLLLIFNYWQRGSSLPNDDVRLAKIARLELARWLQIKGTLMEYFDQSNERLTNVRLEADLRAVNCKVLGAAKAGKASGKVRAAKSRLKYLSKTNSNRTNECSTNVQRTFNERSTNVERTFDCTNNAISNHGIEVAIKEPPARQDKIKIKIKKKTLENPLIPFANPEGLNVDAWETWIAYRKDIKKPLKPASLQAAAKALARYGLDQLAVVEQSKACGYIGLFELKTNGNGKGKATMPAARQWTSFPENQRKPT